MQWIIMFLSVLDLIRRGLGEFSVYPSLENLKPAASPGNALFSNPAHIRGILGEFFMGTFEKHLKLIRTLTRRDLLVVGTAGKYTTNFNVYVVYTDRDRPRVRTVYDPQAIKRGEYRWIFTHPQLHSAQKVYDWYPIDLNSCRLQYDRTRPLLSFEIQHPAKLHDFLETHRVGFY